MKKPVWTASVDEVDGEIFLYRHNGKRIYQGYVKTENSRITFKPKSTIKEAKNEVYQYFDDYARVTSEIKKKKYEKVNLGDAILIILIVLGFFAGIVLKFIGALLTFMGYYYK